MNIIIEEVVSEFPVLITEEVFQITISDAVSYFDIIEVADTSFVGKDEYVPVVDEAAGKIVLKPQSGGGGLTLGETSTTAYRGDRGKTAYDHSQDVTTNPHNVTKSQVGLGSVDNTSDANKPISNDTQSALNNKVDKVTGKGLSTEDYTTTEKSKLASITEIFTTALKTTYDDASAWVTDVGLQLKTDFDALIATGSRLITTTEITKLSNTSGSNSGDNATNTTSNAYADAKVASELASFKTANFLDFTSSGQTQLDGKADVIFSDGVIATGIAVTTEQKLKSYLIPANRIADGSNLLLNIRFHKTFGGGAIHTLRVYVNTSDTLVGATLIGFFSANVAAPQEFGFQRTITIKGSNLSVMNTSGNSTNDLDISNTNLSTIPFNQAINQFLIISVQSAAGHILQITMANLIKN